MISMFRVASGVAVRARVATNALVSTANSRPLRNFSVGSDRYDLVKALDNEIKLTQLLGVMPAVPGDFPFKFKEHYYGSELNLSRKLDGEKISVRVRAFEIDESSSSESSDHTSVDLKVDILKGDGRLMKFVATASADEIAIQRLSVLIDRVYPEMDTVICSQLYIKPDCELQFALRDFLEMRGIRKCIYGFLRDYLLWQSKLPCTSCYQSSTRKFNQQNVETLTKLKEVIQAW